MLVIDTPEEDLIGEKPEQEFKIPETQEELADLLEKARLEGFALGANTANHLLNSKMMVPMAIIESIEDGKLPANMQAMVPMAAQEMSNIADILYKMQHIKRLDRVEEYPSIIDLDKSIKTNPKETT